MDEIDVKIEDEDEEDEEEECKSENDEVSVNPLPEKSKKRYQQAYNDFMSWRERKTIDSFSENVFVAYFGEISEKYKASSLWSIYSMLRSTLMVNHSVDLDVYKKLKPLLKRYSEGYEPNKAKSFTPNQIDRFLNEAPDDTYLVIKVALIMGAIGACRANELYSMKIDHLQDFGSLFLVHVPHTDPYKKRKFTISGQYYEICKKYFDLRSDTKDLDAFFLQYQNGAVRAQRIGLHKFKKMGKQVAKVLKLPDPDKYTGHSIRKSSIKMLNHSGEEMSVLRACGSSESYLDDPMENDTDVDEKNAVKADDLVENDTDCTENKRSSIKIDDLMDENDLDERNTENKRSIKIDGRTNETINLQTGFNSSVLINFTNCSNITVNVINDKQIKQEY